MKRNKLFIVSEKIDEADPWSGFCEVDLIEARDIKSAINKATNRGFTPPKNVVKESTKIELQKFKENITTQILESEKELIDLSNQTNFLKEFLKKIDSILIEQPQVPNESTETVIAETSTKETQKEKDN